MDLHRQVSLGNEGRGGSGSGVRDEVQETCQQLSDRLYF